MRSRGLAPLYAIADADTWGEAELPSLVELWEQSGVRCIQLRAKGLCLQRFETLARNCLERLHPGTTVWINDHVEVARSVGATGVHLGQTDGESSSARRHLGDGQLIGRSTHDLGQALVADADPDVDVIAVGPIFETQSKVDPEPAVGLQQLKHICSQVNKPVVAIGGIGLLTAAEVLKSGAASVAVIGALHSSRVEWAARSLLKAADAPSAVSR